MGDAKVVLASTGGVTLLQPPATVTARSSGLQAFVEEAMRTMNMARDKIAAALRESQQQKDIIATSCRYEKFGSIMNTLALARDYIVAYQRATDEDRASGSAAQVLRQKIGQLKEMTLELAEEAKVCSGETIVVGGKVKIETSPSCFRYPGIYGAPRIMFANRRSVGFGIKFAGEAAYVSNWDKDATQSSGVRGIFTRGFSGINLTRGRTSGKSIFLLGLSIGAGYGSLYRRTPHGKFYQSTESIVRTGIDLTTFALGRYAALVVKGGYQLGELETATRNAYKVRHGGYAGLGIELYIPGLMNFFTPEFTATYAGYDNGRNEFSAGITLRY